MKISGFCLTTNSITFQYPFIESIKSWLPTVDELIVVDGGSTDGTIEAIEKIGSRKIRIINDEESKWEEDWKYSRMGKNFNRGYSECSGDIIIKFDVDYILHEDAWKSSDPKINFRAECERAFKNNALIISFSRLNFIQPHGYFWKKQKSLAINREGLRKRNVRAIYGFDPVEWKFGYEPITDWKIVNDVPEGTLLRQTGNTHYAPHVKVFNYGFMFCDKEAFKWIRYRHVLAERRQLGRALDISEDLPYNEHIKGCRHYMNSRVLYDITLKGHPAIIQDKIRNLKPNQMGYDLFGELPTSKYYV